MHYEKFADGSVKCIEDEIPFDLPEGWMWARIGAICIINPRNSIADDLEVSFIPMPMISEGYANAHTYEVRNWKNVKSGFTHFAENDIGIAKITPCFENRKSVIFKNLVNGYGAGTTELHILRTLAGTISNEYLLWIVKMESFIQGGIQTFSGAVGQQRVGKDFLSQYLIPIPPYNEQIRIIDKINLIFNFIITIENEKISLHETIKQTKSKILDLAIRGHLVPQNPDDEPASVLLDRIRAEKEELIRQGKIKRDKKESIIFKGEDNSYYEKIGNEVHCIEDELPFELPKGWNWVRLKTICSKIIDGSHNPPKGSDEKTPYIMASSRNICFDTVTDLENIRYLNDKDFEKENARSQLTVNDILLTTVATLGRSCIYDGFPENLCFQRSVTVITTNILPQYLKLFFDAPYFQDFILNNATGTAQKGFYLNQLEGVLVSVPPVAEQKRLSDKIQQLLSNIQYIEKSLS